MAIKRQYLSIGFGYDLNDNTRKKASMHDDRKSPSKKPRTNVRIASIETGSEDSDIEPLGVASKGTKITKLAPKWRWNDQRRQIAISKVVAVDLFSFAVEDGSRDSKMREIVLELNKNTEQDINWILLTFDAFRKKVYEIQRKVLKFKDKENMLQVLPEAEQRLYQQLKGIGQVEEAGAAKLSGDTSLVIF